MVAEDEEEQVRVTSGVALGPVSKPLLNENSGKKGRCTYITTEYANRMEHDLKRHERPEEWLLAME